MDSQSDISNGVLDELARFVCDLEYEQIPSEVRELEKQHLMDTLGCIIYGSTTKWVNNFVSTFDALGDVGDATVVGQNRSMSPSTAVLLNGTASHSMDYDDYCLDGGIHAGASTVPPALAYAETNGTVDGETFLTAITAGVEVGVRVGMGMGRGGASKGLHIGGWTGPPAAAATTGKLLGLDENEMAHAISMGLTLGSGLLGAARGSNIKRFHMGRAAESGFLAAHFAKHSIQGDPGILTKQWGSAYSLAEETFEPTKMSENIGEEYALLDTLSFKPFPSVGTIHPSVTALDELLKTNDVALADVAEITIFVSQQVNDKVGWDYVPVDVMSAQGSVKYALSAFLENGTLTIDDYTEETIRRESVLERTEIVNVVTDNSFKNGDYDFLADSPYKRTRRLKMEVQTNAGKTYTRLGEVPKGWPENRMTPTETRVKFRNLAEKVLDGDDLQSLEERLGDLENVTDIATLTALIR